VLVTLFLLGSRSVGTGRGRARRAGPEHRDGGGEVALVVGGVVAQPAQHLVGAGAAGDVELGASGRRQADEAGAGVGGVGHLHGPAALDELGDAGRHRGLRAAVGGGERADGDRLELVDLAEQPQGGGGDVAGGAPAEGAGEPPDHGGQLHGEVRGGGSRNGSLAHASIIA
jgi:hypothetical protein